MRKFPKGFLVGAATAAHQVEGNNTNSDCWAQEQMPHTTYKEKSGIACDHYNRYEEDIRQTPICRIAALSRKVLSRISR